MGRVRFLGPFWPKFSVFEVETLLNYVKPQGNHISLEFKLLVEQNDTFT